MDYYLELQVLPDPEFSEIELINALFAKLHRALPQVATGDQLGVSFPKVNSLLGDTLRVHGSKANLTQLMSLPWLKGLRDYCEISDISPVPAQVHYRCVRRVQQKSVHNKRQRSIAKGWLTEDEAVSKVSHKHKPLTLPFVQATSLSSRQKMKIFIEHGALQDKPNQGQFSSYGLSGTATIPWF